MHSIHVKDKVELADIFEALVQYFDKDVNEIKDPSSLSA